MACGHADLQTDIGVYCGRELMLSKASHRESAMKAEFRLVLGEKKMILGLKSKATYRPVCSVGLEYIVSILAGEEKDHKTCSSVP